MLQHLSITNYAIINKLQLDLKSGFSVITGETGAGKSILLGALSLILGNRADSSVLNDKSKKCIVEGEFLLNKTYLSFFNHHDLDFDENTLLRREIAANGKSRAFINDTPVSLSVMKDLTNRIIDVHSQSESLLLKSRSFQINVLDAYAQNLKEFDVYKESYSIYKLEKDKLDELKELSSKSSTDYDYLKFQATEIEELKLQPNEKEDIEEQLKVVNNAEEIKAALDYSTSSLIHSDENILEVLKDIKNRFSKILSYSNVYEDVHSRLSSLIIELEDIAYTINNSNNEFDFDQENVNHLNSRLSKIYTIEQKHKLNSTEEILVLLKDLQSKIEASGNYEENITAQESKVEDLFKNTIERAQNLSVTRNKAISSLEKEIKENLRLLGMPQSQFKIESKQLDIPNEFGIDQIDFFFSANKGFEPKLLAKVASGGELSRLMLVIKMFLVKGSKINTIIFDEIDTGVSGDIASKMGEMMSKMAANTQVLSITHLPQVAAKGSSHYKIIKDSSGDNTYTSVVELNKDERVLELAKMLSGDKVSDAAVKNANVLLESN